MLVYSEIFFYLDWGWVVVWFCEMVVVEEVVFWIFLEGNIKNLFYRIKLLFDFSLDEEVFYCKLINEIFCDYE